MVGLGFFEKKCKQAALLLGYIAMLGKILLRVMTNMKKVKRF